MKIRKDSWHYKFITLVIPEHKQDPPTTLGAYVGITTLLLLLGVGLIWMLGLVAYLLSIIIGSEVIHLIFGIDTRSLVATSSYENLVNHEQFKNNAKLIISSGILAEVLLGFLFYGLYKSWKNVSVKLKVKIDYE